MEPDSASCSWPHGLWERQGVGGTIKRIKGDLMTQVWIVDGLAGGARDGFKFIPAEQRVLYINTIWVL